MSGKKDRQVPEKRAIIKKGGKNPPPKTPKPNFKPSGQGVKPGSKNK